MQLGALRSALSAKLRDGDLLVVSAFQLASPKTKDMVATLKKFDAAKKVLLVDTADNRNLELSARNLQGVAVVRSNEVHPYHLLGANRILLSQAAASKLSESLAKSAPKSRQEANRS
jgi:large subunit ribosomal protein L4